MKKYNSISLIETLISLTIVGVSIIALLPVMTVRNTSEAPGKGSNLWDNTTLYANADKTQISAIGANNVSVGTNKVPIDVQSQQKVWPNDGRPDSRPFVVQSGGYGNRNIVPLFVKERLAFNGYEIFTNDDVLHLRAMGVVYCTNGAANCDANPEYKRYKFLRNLYVDDNKTIISNENSGITGDTFTRDEMKVNGKEIIDRNFVLINNARRDYIVFDGNNIGIGRNALRYSNLDENSAGNIVIANNNHNPANAIDTKVLDNYIAIGAQNDSPEEIDNNAYYTIHYKPDDNIFTINADVQTNTLQTKGLILGSDRRLKNIIGAYKKGLYEIEKLKPVEFTYKNDSSNTVHVGVIAQDLQEIFPDSVVKDPNTGYYLIITDEIFYALLNSIKELNEKNKAIEKDNDVLEAKIAELKKIRDNLKAKKGGSHE